MTVPKYSQPPPTPPRQLKKLGINKSRWTKKISHYQVKPNRLGPWEIPYALYNSGLWPRFPPRRPSTTPAQVQYTAHILPPTAWLQPPTTLPTPPTPPALLARLTRQAQCTAPPRSPLFCHATHPPPQSYP